MCENVSGKFSSWKVAPRWRLKLDECSSFKSSWDSRLGVAFSRTIDFAFTALEWWKLHDFINFLSHWWSSSSGNIQLTSSQPSTIKFPRQPKLSSIKVILEPWNFFVNSRWGSWKLDPNEPNRAASSILQGSFGWLDSHGQHGSRGF